MLDGIPSGRLCSRRAEGGSQNIANSVASAGVYGRIEGKHTQIDASSRLSGRRDWNALPNGFHFMKACHWCRREHEEDAAQCEACGVEFPDNRSSESHGGPRISSGERIVFWFKVYAAVLGTVYLLCGAWGLSLIYGEPSERGFGGLILITCSALLTGCAIPLVTKPRPWVWKYDLVLICIGMTSACFLPACIPLLIGWFKPETKLIFGITEKAPSGSAPPPVPTTEASASAPR
jgi:hypothetical protein